MKCVFCFFPVDSSVSVKQTDSDCSLNMDGISNVDMVEMF